MGRAERLVRAKRCARCGRTFYMRCELADYGWQIHQEKGGRRLYCSYSCMREVEIPRVKRNKVKIAAQLCGITKKCEDL